MAHPLEHAKNSARRFGGVPDDYLPIHKWFDESKAIMADVRHRTLRHHAEGIFLAERIFGIAIRDSEREGCARPIHRRAACSEGPRAHTQLSGLGSEDEVGTLDVRAETYENRRILASRCNLEDDRGCRTSKKLLRLCVNHVSFLLRMTKQQNSAGGLAVKPDCVPSVRER
jgi:hypothetical protein